MSEVKAKSVSIHADSDRGDTEEDGDESDSTEESKEESPTKETDAIVELVFRKVLMKGQKDRLLKDYPKPSTDAAHVSVLDSSISAAYYQTQPADSQLYKIQRSVLDAANPIIKAFELLQHDKDEEVDIAEVSKAEWVSLHLFGGAIKCSLDLRKKEGSS